MTLEEILPRELVVADLPRSGAEDCLRELVHRVQRVYTCLDGPSLTQRLLESARAQGLRLEAGVAIAHVLHSQFQQVVLAVGRLPEEIRFTSAGAPEASRALFLLVLPEGRPGLLRTLGARVARLAARPDFLARFLAAMDREALYDEIVAMDGHASGGDPGGHEHC
ncbi:MAG: PTS sugar transporter subunit IIA [Deltaproteobacteria bacterium]|nr:PTS sugar transporter subunit IIA [Deltaproteobacteria bacterium]